MNLSKSYRQNRLQYTQNRLRYTQNRLRYTQNRLRYTDKITSSIFCNKRKYCRRLFTSLYTFIYICIYIYIYIYVCVFIIKYIYCTNKPGISNIMISLYSWISSDKLLVYWFFPTTNNI